LAIAHHLGLHRWSALEWQRLRKKLVRQQITPDLFINVAASAPESVEKPGAAPAADGVHPAPAPGETSAASEAPAAPPDTAEDDGADADRELQTVRPDQHELAEAWAHWTRTSLA
jgi:hypothetical protein